MNNPLPLHVAAPAGPDHTAPAREVTAEVPSSGDGPETPQNAGNAVTLSAAHVQELNASGIPDTVAHGLGLRSADAEEVKNLLAGSDRVGGGLVIPFHDLQGRAHEFAGRPFVRVRLDTPLRVGDGDAKYLSPYDSGVWPSAVRARSRTPTMFGWSSLPRILTSRSYRF